MITCEKLEKKPRVFKNIVGVSVVEFEKMYQKFIPLWDDSEQKRLGSSTRQRAIGGGRRYTLAPRDRLLMTLVWLHLRLGKQALGFFFGTDKSTASRNTRRVLPILYQLGNSYPEPPCRGESKSIKDALHEYPDLLAIVDAMEQPIEIESVVVKPGHHRRHNLDRQLLQRRIWGEQFSIWIDELREAGVVQRHLAHYVDPSPSAISKWKSGKGTPEVHAEGITRGLLREGASLTLDQALDWWSLVAYRPSKKEIKTWYPKWKTAESKITTLDMQTTGLSWNVYVEREKYIENLHRLLLEEKHFREPLTKRVCIWGMGGVGKTILAKAVAMEDQIQSYFRDGVLWATLGPDGDAAPWLRQWCKLLRLSVGETESVWELCERVKAYLASVEQRYLIVIDDAWRLEDVEPLLVDGPQSRVLITSREKELAFKLDPQMSIIQLDVMSQRESLALLQYRIAPEQWQELRVNQRAKELVDLVEMLPLAIALATDVVNTRGCDYALRRLRDEYARLGLLEKNKIERREHSVKLAFNVSYKAQPTANQQLFRWLCVFSHSGDFAPFTVARLFSEENILQVEERLRRLVDSSLLLLSYKDAQEGIARFRLHALLHDYGREKLQAAGEWDRARQQYVAMYIHQAREWQKSLGRVATGLQEEWQTELSNVTQAILHADDLGWWNDIAAMVDYLASLARMSGQLGLLVNWLDRLESHSDQLHVILFPRIIKIRVELAATIRQWDEVIAKGSSVVHDETIDAEVRGYVWLNMALAWQHHGDTVAASKAWQQGWQCAEESDDSYLLAGAFRLKGDLMLLQGKPPDSLREYSRAEKAYLKLERGQLDLISVYTQMGEVYGITGQNDLALRVFRQAMSRSLAAGWPLLIFKVGQKLVVLEMMMGNLEEAKEIVAELDPLLSRFVDAEPFRSEQIGIFLRSKSIIEYQEENYKRAAELAEEALTHLQAGDVDADTLGFTWCMLGEIRLAMQDYVGALQAAQRSRVMYEQSKVWQEVQQQVTKLIERVQQGIAGRAQNDFER